MSAPPKLGWLLLLLGPALAAPACRYGLDPNSGQFHCATDGDCGNGWHCLLSCKRPEFSPYCIVNGGCDPCPDLSSDPANCGGCGHACAATASCLNGSCVETLVDGGPEDAGLVDGGADAGSDAGYHDGGLIDGGLADGGRGDGGLADGGRGDGGDAGSADASVDGGAPDGSLDGGLTDAGAADAGDAG